MADKEARLRDEEGIWWQRGNEEETMQKERGREETSQDVHLSSMGLQEPASAAITQSLSLLVRSSATAAMLVPVGASTTVQDLHGEGLKSSIDGHAMPVYIVECLFRFALCKIPVDDRVDIIRKYSEQTVMLL